LIEFWKHCLNQVQFRTIDTEALRAVMEVVKGGKEEWSSVGKSKWGLALNGPFILDDEKDRNQTPSPTAARKGRSSKMIQNEGPSVKKEPVEETAKNDDVTFGLCKWECNKPWERSDMVRCCGKVRFTSVDGVPGLLTHLRWHRHAKSSGSIARVSKVSGGGHKIGSVLTAKRHSLFFFFFLFLSFFFFFLVRRTYLLLILLRLFSFGLCTISICLERKRLFFSVLTESFYVQIYLFFLHIL
jgi:hypothetical protein